PQTPVESQAATEIETQAPLQAEIAPEFAPAFAPEFAVANEKDIHAIPREESRDLRPELLQVAEALDQHRLWVESNGKEGIRGDFAGANFSDADLTGVNLQSADLTKVNLRGADLSMANLRGANLVEADLR